MLSKLSRMKSMWLVLTCMEWSQLLRANHSALHSEVDKVSVDPSACSKLWGGWLLGIWTKRFIDTFPCYLPRDGPAECLNFFESPWWSGFTSTWNRISLLISLKLRSPAFEDVNYCSIAPSAILRFCDFTTSKAKPIVITIQARTTRNRRWFQCFRCAAFCLLTSRFNIFTRFSFEIASTVAIKLIRSSHCWLVPSISTHYSQSAITRVINDEDQPNRFQYQ